MRSIIQALVRGACIAAVVLLAGGSSLAQTAPSAPGLQPAPGAGASAAPLAAGSQPDCLACHGPYEKIMAATASYCMPSGETTSPHKYVPHKSKNIPECRNCHTAHALPPPSKASVRKPWLAQGVDLGSNTLPLTRGAHKDCSPKFDAATSRSQKSARNPAPAGRVPNPDPLGVSGSVRLRLDQLVFLGLAVLPGSSRRRADDAAGLASADQAQDSRARIARMNTPQYSSSWE